MALVRHGDTLDLVLDGHTADTHAMTGSFTDPSASPTFLGVSRCSAGAPGGNGTADPRLWLRGAIDEVAFYDRARSPEERLAVAEGRCAPQCIA